MKIGQQPDIPPAAVPPIQPAAARAGQPAVPATRNERKAPDVDVTVSDLARKLEQTRGDAPEVDLDKVNAVRLAIEQKTYQVSPEAIADKLLANAREMLNRSAS